MFFKIYGVFARTMRWGGWASADIFRTRGKGSIFAILCGRPLWTTPNFQLLHFLSNQEVFFCFVLNLEKEC